MNIKPVDSKYVDLKHILYNSVITNRGIIPSMVILFMAYWIQDVVFFGSFSKFTSDIPKFMQNINFNSVASLIFPYIISELLFYINNIIVSHSIPEIELSIVEELTKETLESIKTSKTVINTNEYIMNLKKVIESKAVYYLIVSNIIPTILIALGIVYYFSTSNIKMGLATFIIITIFFLITLNICMETIATSYKNENAINVMYDNIQDIISNADLVITSNSINKETNNVKNDKNTVYDTYLTSETTSSESQFKLRLLSLTTVFLLDFFAMYLYYTNSMNIETVISICTMSIVFLKYYNAMSSRFKSTIGYIGKFCEISDYFANFKIHENKDTKPFEIKNGDINFKNIYVKIGDKQILNNFSFNVKGNTKVGILGDIGKGKTTILKILSGLLNYDGIVEIDGQNIKECDYDSVMKHIAYIPQNPKMFSKDIYYNLSYGSNKSEQEILDYLTKLNFSDFLKVFPNGIKTKVGKDGSKLSGGQKQLIAILRALIQNKKVILLDEPTNSLDIQTKKIVMELIQKIQNKTILVVTHDENMFDLFDDYIMLKN